MNIKSGPVDNRSQDPYSSRYRYDNESSTDEEISEGEEESSSDDDDFKSKIGQIATKTSQQGKVRIKSSENPEEKEEVELDDFEKEMGREMEERMLKAEQEASIANTEVITQTEIDMDVGEEEGASGLAKLTAEKKDRYDEIYFDSDEEDAGGTKGDESSGPDKKKYQTDDELLYDPKMDDEDQSWVDDVRRSYQNPDKHHTTKQDQPKPLANSDAVLNCPACFSVVCLDCQRHSIYKTQYRAMFVINCSVITDELMKIPIKKKGKGRKGPEKAITHPDDEYHPVRCDQCRTEIAMYDKDEVYHFFNVVASHT